MIMMAILVVGFGSLFLAAGPMLKPLVKAANVGQDLTHLFTQRGDIAEGTRVLSGPARGGTGDRLAAEGRGMVLELTPSDAVRARPEGLRALARSAARGAFEAYEQDRLDWVELRLLVGATREEALRTLVKPDPDGRGVGEPTPPLPLTHPPRTGPDAPGAPPPGEPTPPPSATPPENVAAPGETAPPAGAGDPVERR
jgi:hypothetical protein